MCCSACRPIHFTAMAKCNFPPISNALCMCTAGIPAAPITWPDLAVLGAKVSAERAWFVAKKARLGAGADVDTISKAFGADFPVFLGRKEGTVADPPAKFPDPTKPLEVRVRMSCCCAQLYPAQC